MILRGFAVLLLFILEYSDALPSKNCKIPNGNGGTCTLLADCDPLNRLYTKKAKTSEEETYFRQSVARCGTRRNKIVVCCSPMSQWSDIVIKPVEFPVTPNIITQKDVNLRTPVDEQEVNSRISNSTIAAATKNEQGDEDDQLLAYHNRLRKYGQIPEVCGNDTSSDRIVGGNATGIDEYPWMALLEYKPEQFRCGGSLISRRHVLTAAHCLYNIPSKVRLSEYNISSDPDHVELDGGGHDEISVVIVDVLRTVAHSDHKFSTSVNDIGLITMKWAIEFGRFIKPICLPTSDYKLSDFTIGKKFIVAGWGSDNVYTNSEVKRAVFVPYVPLNVCKESFSNYLTEEQHLCAGGEKGRDSCQGDSGGPLMYKDPSTMKFVIVGIVSTGATECGQEGSPGVHMYVYNYVDWIYDVMDNDV